MGNFRVPGVSSNLDNSADIKSIVRQQTRFNSAVRRNMVELQRGGISDGNISNHGIGINKLIQNVVEGSVLFVGDSKGAAVLAQDNTNFFFSQANQQLTLGKNPILLAMTPGNIPFIGGGSVLSQNVKLTWDDSNVILKDQGALCVGTVTDATAPGDLCAGLTAAARLFYKQGNGRASLIDAAGNEKIRWSTSEDNYWNAPYNLGIGTVTPRRFVDILAAANQLRLSNADNTIYTDLSTDGSGNFTIAPTGTLLKVALGANGQRVDIGEVTELTTIAAAATTDTVITIPLNAVVLAVTVRVTVVIPTAATFTVTGTTSGTQFDVAGGVSTAATTTDLGTRNCPFKNGAAQTIRITPNVNPAANSGRVRVTVHYYTPVAPTS